MAVEFRCPECKAKLRLADAPEPGEEVECPKCGELFAAPDRAADAPPPAARKRPARDDDTDDDRPARKPKPKKAKKPAPPPAGEPPKGRKKKKVKKNPLVIAGFVVGGLVALGMLVFILTFLFGRTRAATEMLGYVPGDFQSASGINMTQIQKYPVFYKALDDSLAGTDVVPAGNALAKALGGDRNELFDNVIVATDPKGGGDGTLMVFRTKAEYDTAALAKLPGARPGQAEGLTYHTVDGPGVMAGARVFGPTPRLIVVASAAVSDAAFRTSVRGKDNRDESLGAKMGAFGDRMSRGNIWTVVLKGSPSRVILGQEDKQATGDAPSGYGKNAGQLANGPGHGVRFNVGSKAMKVEFVLWCTDADAASAAAKELNDSDMAKGDDGTPPSWWKKYANTLGPKKVGTTLLSYVSYSPSGELMVAKADLDMALAQDGMGALASKVVRRTAAAPPQQ